MKDVNPVFKLHYVHNPEGIAVFCNPYLSRSRSNRRKWLPIVRVFAVLDFIQLKPCITARAIGKISQIIQRRAYKLDLLRLILIQFHLANI